jgi:hypothetical protein
MKNYDLIKANVGTHLQDTSTAFDTIIGTWVNSRYRDIVNSYDWEQLYHSQSFATSANTSAYALDENTDRVVFVKDRTNEAYLEPITEQDFLTNYYDDLDTTGTPEVCFLTSEPVASQPGSAERAIVKSSSISDTTITILLRGITSAGMETYESLTLNGTTAVTASNSYTQILGFSKSAATTGKITLYDNDGTSIIAVMSPESLVSRYKILNIHPTPTAGATMELRTKRKVLPLSQDYDYPIIEDIDELLEIGAEADAWRYKRQFAKATALETQYQIMKSDRIHREVAQPDIIHQFQPQVLDRDLGIL